MTEEQNTEALKKARTFSDNKDKIDGFYNGYVQATIELEKENAELKEKYVKNITDCDICDTYCNSQLTKAKEIIREFVEWATWQGSNCPNFKSIQDKAEQFLKSSEVEK